MGMKKAIAEITDKVEELYIVMADRNWMFPFEIGPIEERKEPLWKVWKALIDYKEKYGVSEKT